MTLLAVVATAQEQAALLRDVPFERFAVGPYAAARTSAGDVLVAGIGPAAAGAGTATGLALGSYDLCLSLGICGAFRGTADLGDTILATELVAADLGADSPAGFLGLSALGWSDEVVSVSPALLQAALARLGANGEPHSTPRLGNRPMGIPNCGELVTGPVLTVSTVTGTRARADELALRHGAVGEAMEGWGVWQAAQAHGLPVLEVRTVSNLVGDRDTATWDFALAFDTLAGVGTALLGEPWR